MPSAGAETDAESTGQGEACGTSVPAENAAEGSEMAAEGGADTAEKGVLPAPKTDQNEVQEDKAPVTLPNAAPVNEAAEKPMEQDKQTNQPAISVPRDYNAEWKELAEAHPEIVGTTLPEDIFQACIRSEKHPLQVYESMMLKRLQGEIAQLKQENDQLRQNASNAQRAPVSGTAAGGSTGKQEEDPFVTAFRRYH